jgi:hypothetical protein
MVRNSPGAFGTCCALLMSLMGAANTATAASVSAVAFSASNYDVNIGAAAVTVTINRSGGSAGAVIATYETINGTALAGTDYSATSGTLNWSDGDVAPKSFIVPINPTDVGSRTFAIALISVSGALFGSPIDATVSIAAPVTDLFPQIGVQTYSGSQYFAPANDAQLAQYGLVVLGGNYVYWPELQGRSRDEIVVSLKSQTHTGRNALTPLVFQYENAIEMDLASPWFPEWTSAVIRNNWFVYQLGAAGAISDSVWDASLVLANPNHVVGTDPSSGLYPYGLLANLLYQRYYLGTGSGGAAMASTHLNGYFLDNMSQENVAASAADWERNGTNPSRTDPAATAAVTLGKADYPAQIAVLDPNLIAGGNTEAGYDMSPAAVGGLGMTWSNLSGQLGLGMQQFEWGTAGGQNNVLNCCGFAAAMSWYQTLESNIKPGGYVLMTGGVLATDYQLVRYSLGLTLMRNGWAVYAISNTGFDIIDPNVVSTYPVFDEFWGGTLDTAGYLGAASTTVQGAEQSGPWLQGVWRRDFANGIALVNPDTNGTQTVQLGGTFYHLIGSQVPNINNGTAVSSVTIAAGDGVILLRRPPPP